MTTSLDSTRNHRRLRVVGLVAAIASLAAACGSSTTVPANEAGSVVVDPTDLTEPTVVSPGATVVVEADASASASTERAEQPTTTPAPAPTTTTAPAPTTTTAPVPAPTTTAPAPDPAPTTTTAPEPNDPPVFDTVRITRVGVNVTVGINASDADGDALSLRLTSLGPDGQHITHEAEADAAIFELPFSADATGTVTIMTSVSDGTDTTIQNDSIDIAPLMHVTFGTAEISASNGCFNTDDSVTLKNTSVERLIDPRGTLVSGAEFVSPITLTRQNRGSQLLRTPLEADFEITTGFAAQLLLSATFGDIEIRIDAGHVQPGRYEPPTFVSPSNAACWVTIGYAITVEPAA